MPDIQIFRQNLARVLRIYIVWALVAITAFIAIGEMVRITFLFIALAVGAAITSLRRYLILDEGMLIVKEGGVGRTVARRDVLSARAYRSLRDAKRGERVRTMLFIIPGGPCLVVRLRQGSARRRWPIDHKDGNLLFLFPQDPEKVAREITTWAAVPEDASPTRPSPA